jgi:hypothetical protein
MNYQLDDRGWAQLYEPALLRNESMDEYNFFRRAIEQQIQPKTFIEHLWASDLVDGEHEMWRLRRFKAQIVRSKTPRALQNLLRSVRDVYESAQIDYLAAKWFTNKAVRRTVSRILRDFGLDEASIDAEAFRLSIEDIAACDRRIAELERSRDRLLDRIEDHRAGLAVQVTAILDQPPEYNALLPHRASAD